MINNIGVKECIKEIEAALWSCARSCTLTTYNDNAFKMVECVEKLTDSLCKLQSTKILFKEESEDK